MIRTASCSCGALRAECSGQPVKVSLCHCLACQRRTGSAYGIAAFFDRRCVEVLGPENTFTRASDSGFDVKFHFCPSCGSSVYWEPLRKPGMIAVAVGAFADPAFPAPTQAVYAQDRHPWVDLAL